MSEIKMLPLPEDAVEWLRQYGVANTAFQMEVIEGWFQAHARAVAEHNVAARDAEIEALRDGLDYIANMSGAADILELRAKAARAERLAEALRWYVENDDTNEGQEGNEYWLAGRDRAIAALRDHDQEGKDAT